MTSFTSLSESRSAVCAIAADATRIRPPAMTPAMRYRNSILSSLESRTCENPHALTWKGVVRSQDGRADLVRTSNTRALRWVIVKHDTPSSESDLRQACRAGGGVLAVPGLRPPGECPVRWRRGRACSRDDGEAPAANAGRFARSVRPRPVDDLRPVDAVLVRVIQVVDDRVLHLLFQVRGRQLQLR